MYKKIIEQLVQRNAEQFINEHFKPNWVGAGSSHQLKVTYDKENNIVKYKCEVMADVGRKMKVGDIELPIFDHYLISGLVHDTGNISIMRVTKVGDGIVAEYNIATHSLQICKKVK